MKYGAGNNTGCDIQNCESCGLYPDCSLLTRISGRLTKELKDQAEVQRAITSTGWESLNAFIKEAIADEKETSEDRGI